MSCNRSNPHPSASRFKPHDHGAIFCGRPNHWRGLVALFMRDGLASDQRCLYLHGLSRPLQECAPQVGESLPAAGDLHGSVLAGDSFLPFSNPSRGGCLRA